MTKNPNWEEEIALLLRALEPEVFQFIVVRHCHNDAVMAVEQALANKFPDRRLTLLSLQQALGKELPKAIVEQGRGIMLVQDFEKILGDDDLRVGFNQRRGKIASLPIALVLFIPESTRVLRDLQEGLQDFWSIRNHVMHLPGMNRT